MKSGNKRQKIETAVDTLWEFDVLRTLIPHHSKKEKCCERICSYVYPHRQPKLKTVLQCTYLTAVTSNKLCIKLFLNAQNLASKVSYLRLPVNEALLYCNCAFCSDTAFVRLPHCYSLKFRRFCSRIYLSHDSNWRGPHSLSNLVFYQVEHVLVIKQADQVERTKAGCTPQGQIPDYHGAVEVNKIKRFWVTTGQRKLYWFHFLG